MTAEQQQDGAAEDVTAFLDAWEAEHGSGSIRGGNADVPYLFSSDLRGVLAERNALAARVAELEEQCFLGRVQLTGAQARIDYLEGRASR